MGQIFTDIAEVKKYINVSKGLDVKLLSPYEEEAIRYIGKVIPEQLFQQIADYPQVYPLLCKAVANYMLPFAAPFLKIHLSNTGANNFDDAKMHKSEWWDVRDYCLSAIKIADNALSDAVELLQDTPLKKKLTLFENESIVAELFPTPKAFGKVHNIANSWFVFRELEPFIYSAIDIYLLSRLKTCTITDLLANEKLVRMLRDLVAAYALADALIMSNLSATVSGLVLQWEQLPWQKSALLSEERLEKIAENYMERANTLFNRLLEYIKEHPADFPCYQPSERIPIRKVIEKKSGLYL